MIWGGRQGKHLIDRHHFPPYDGHPWSAQGKAGQQLKVDVKLGSRLWWLFISCWSYKTERKGFSELILFDKYVFFSKNNISLQKLQKSPLEPIPTSVCEQIPWQIEIVMEQRWDGDLSWGFLPYVPIAQFRRWWRAGWARYRNFPHIVPLVGSRVWGTWTRFPAILRPWPSSEKSKVS